MERNDDGEGLLRSVTLRNAKSTHPARQRTEQELDRVKEALQRKTEELAHSLAMMRAMLESTTDGILVTDDGGKVTGFNERFVEMWRISREIMDLRDHRQILQVTSQFFKEPHQFIARIEDICKSSTPDSFDLLGLADGRVFERYSRIQFVEVQNVGRVWSFRDITDRKRAEENLRQLAADLSEADRRKNEFLAMLAHELRNPLAPIRNAAEILRLTSGKGQTVERVQATLERQVKHMGRLVDDLLEVSQLTRGKMQLRKERIELARVVEAALETSSPRIQAAGHELVVSLFPETTTLEADPVRLAQVLSNLLNNAAKYTDRGGSIWLTTERQGAEVVMRVRDSGIGIPAEMLPHIFEMYNQVDDLSDRTQGGLGIGLTVVKSLVEMHGGSVEAHSAGAGQGSEFTVRIPLAPEPCPRLQEGIVSEAALQLETLPKHRVLIVDDNQDVAETLGMILDLLGSDVRVVHDGPDALKAVFSYQPSVVLLDIGMPGMDGYEVARRVRRQAELKDIRLIALTGWDREEDRRRCREAGFDQHLVKPIGLDALEELLASPPAAPHSVPAVEHARGMLAALTEAIGVPTARCAARRLQLASKANA